MFQNFGIKTLCLLIALLLWLQAAATTEVEGIRRLPVEITGLSDSLTVIANRLPASISVRLRGSRLQILSADLFDQERGKVDLDLEGFTPGHHRYDVSVLDVVAPGTPLNIVPEVSLDIHVERRIIRRVPVQLVSSGELPGDVVFVTGLDVAPAMVELAGPESLVMAVEHVSSEAFALDHRRNSFSEHIRLESPGSELTMRPIEVEVSAGIEPVEERIFEAVPLTVLREDDQMRIELVPSQARVVVVGARSVLAALSAAEISVLVTIPGGVEGVSEVAAEAVVPDGVLSARVEPQTFQVVAEVERR